MMRVFGLTLLGFSAANAAVAPANLRTEYLRNPEAIDASAPRLTWLLESPVRGDRQTGYRIVAASSAVLLAKDRGDLWDTGKVASAETVSVPYAGKRPGPGARVWWKVQVWDAAGKPSKWSAPAYWNAAPGGFQARWISHRDSAPLHDRSDRLYLPHARYYRKTFDTSKKVVRAMLYGTALGVFDAYLNGKRVSDDMFSPGWSDYRQRAYYRAWDVADKIVPGANALGAELAEGWYSGYVGYGLLVGYGPNKSGRAFYGKTPALLLELRIEYADGSRAVVATGPGWRTAPSPRVEADILMGETYDARRESPGWCTAGFDDSRWEPAIPPEENGPAKAVFFDRAGEREMDFGFAAPKRLQAHTGPPVRPIEELRPKRILEPAPGTWVFDFGQNFSGVVRLRVRGRAGDSVRLRHAEMIYPGGRLMTENLRRARATDTYTLRGDPAGEIFTPRFTYHGFQYVELTGFPGKPSLDDVAGIVVHSDTPLASSFESSDPMVNRLFRNIVWTQRSNFFEVPTDCPQRDERLGWTGDAQIYAPTAAINADTAAFYTKWLDDLDEAQRPDGAFPDYAPYPMQHGPGGPFASAWMDAGIVVPWAVWRAYGDVTAIERHWPAMTKFMDFRKARSPEGRGVATGNPYGDWLSIGAATPLEFVDAVYFAYAARLMAEMAGALGKSAQASEYAGLYNRVRDRFRADYVKSDGSLAVDTQSAYAMALSQDLIPRELRSRSAELLAGLIRANDYRMTTGFLGTYPLLPSLTATGHHDLAARLFQSRRFPSWGYEVENGATTIWERWNSYTHDKGFFEPGMNSYSHYAFGAVGEWMFRSLVGIAPLEPGYRRVLIAPGPPSPGSNPENPPVDRVSAEHRSIRGTIRVSWTRAGDAFDLEATVPPNVEAVVVIPARDSASVTESGRPARVEKVEAGRAWMTVPSGTWRFRSRL